MIKSAKGQLILSTITATLFIIASFSFIQFNDGNSFFFGPVVFYILMLLNVFHAGLLTQKYIQFKNDDTD
ncbi:MULTISPECIES: hypothetical protein [unclassified Psychrobacillus]|uniref:hypothetical protein n=1 Tax=unclassified Psychrobacillus TaxID=2636677 RepID=UPI001469B1F6|nr:hypothetical protein [Psychrobacillus sp. BL-248-WT-3]NME06442.1 hypothetical protein [Psychrobacillus sp. BL-248-WT-3]